MTHSPGNLKAGALDPSFGDGGKVQLPIPEVSAAGASGILALPNGKLLTVMPLLGVEAPMVVLRLNEDGTLDTTFGNSGTGYIELPEKGIEPILVGINSLSDGGSIIGARFGNAEGFGTIIIKLRENGEFNSEFGNNGVVRLAIWGREQQREQGSEDESDSGKAEGNWRYSAIEDANGKIVLVDQTLLEQGIRAIAIRLNVDGSLDDTFDRSSSRVELPGVEYTWTTASGVAVQSDTKVLVCGRYGDDLEGGIYVVRFDSEGRADPTFNNNRPFIMPLVNAAFRAIAIGNSAGAEKILVVGDAEEGDEKKGLIVVLNEQGSYDSAFNNGAPLFATLYAKDLVWRKCDWRPDGRIVITGTAGNLNTSHNGVLAARYRPDGSLDPQFNDGVGYVVYEGIDGPNMLRDMVVMADERIVISCFEVVGGSGYEWILRYLG
ncbi:MULTISPECIES: hypothetical protein [unclassified Pseudomonas]|uniref:hypothetical protein n=1 Tax=unclassified Pseudomonas TaxID=196821 RepID=UPI000871B11C|nr:MULTISPECIES: hypothetical protein [unclassified Pseudomonas]SCW59750.1 delta-60 repeat domain-containing protein [Pseudomonas sp. NFACC56-3]SFK90751.1 delta-60 repeat domain-containing protein [Pseudomonas sp. NFACC52]